MKNNIFKTMIAGSMMALLLLAAPFTSFAKNDNNNGNKLKAKAEVKAMLKADRKDNNDNNGNRIGFWARFLAALQANRANAQNDGSIITNIRAMSPSISSITAPTTLKVGAEGTWKVSASDPNNGSLTYSVNWGDERTNMAKDQNEAFVQQSTFTHAYAKAGTYKATFTVKNNLGLKATASATVKVTGDAEVKAPVISGLSVSSDKPHKARLSWNTDVKSNTQVWYGKTTPVSTSGEANVSKRGNVTNHNIVLTKLDANTKYYVVVGSKNEAGMTLSAETSFTTPALPDRDAPVIRNISGPSNVLVGATATVTIRATDSSNGSLTYSADWGDSTALRSLDSSKGAFAQSATFTHVYTQAGNYTAKFTVKDQDGKTDTASLNIKVSADINKPVISDVRTQTSANGSVVTWKTDELSTSKVFFGSSTPLDINAAGTASVSNDTLVKEHSLNISGLTAQKTYYYVVKSVDASGNAAVSGEANFTTSPGS